MSDSFVRLKRSNDGAVYQLIDALSGEVFKNTDSLFNEGSRVHDQIPFEFFNIVPKVRLACWTLVPCSSQDRSIWAQTLHFFLRLAVFWSVHLR
jgi:hypothetical protein